MIETIVDCDVGVSKTSQMSHVLVINDNHPTNMPVAFQTLVFLRSQQQNVRTMSILSVFKQRIFQETPPFSRSAYLLLAEIYQSFQNEKIHSRNQNFMHFSSNFLIPNPAKHKKSSLQPQFHNEKFNSNKMNREKFLNNCHFAFCLLFVCLSRSLIKPLSKRPDGIVRKPKHAAVIHTFTNSYV